LFLKLSFYILVRVRRGGGAESLTENAKLFCLIVFFIIKVRIQVNKMWKFRMLGGFFIWIFSNKSKSFTECTKHKFAVEIGFISIIIITYGVLLFLWFIDFLNTI
jgi:hypothetical protein